MQGNQREIGGQRGMVATLASIQATVLFFFASQKCASRRSPLFPPMCRGRVENNSELPSECKDPAKNPKEINAACPLEQNGMFPLSLSVGSLPSQLGTYVLYV